MTNAEYWRECAYAARRALIDLVVSGDPCSVCERADEREHCRAHGDCATCTERDCFCVGCRDFNEFQWTFPSREACGMKYD